VIANLTDSNMKPDRHFTTRRGFIAAFGFGGVSLYGLWAAYGAAPNPISLLDNAASAQPGSGPVEMMAMEGHGAMGSAPDIDAFRTELADYVSRFSEPDGTVYPRPAPEQMVMSGMDMTSDGQDPQVQSEHAEMENPVDVLLLAERYYFDPPAMRLDLNRPYRFRMLSADVTHGASIQFGTGARMIRLAPGAETELEMTFTRPGSFLVYCTSYCGPGHDGMQASITVA
jgi:cytochrome c oxidase subunit 2